MSLVKATRVNPWLLLLLLLLGSFCYLPGAGQPALPVWDLLEGSASEQQQLIWQQLRLPRLLMALLAGAALALCGALMQLLTRNDLADPYLFGVVAGAGLGATLSSLWFPHWQLGLPLAAFAGAAVVLLLVLLLSGRLRSNTLLLVGIAMSFAASSLTSLLLYQADAFAANRIVFWLMGSLARPSWLAVNLLASALLITVLLCVLARRQLRALAWSEQMAESLGVRTWWWRSLFLTACALLCALVVSFCGGIGFIGLMMPHIAQRLFGSQLLAVLLGSAGCGALFLLWTDHAARTLWPPQELPLGVLTALAGSLFFLLILFTKQRQYE
jgi:iron complex transport system permease protein